MVREGHNTMKRILLVISLLLSSSAFGAELLIPAVFRGPGAYDTLWRTEIVLSNVTSDPRIGAVPVTLTYHGNDGATAQVKITLSPMEVYDLTDALPAWFNVENGGGILRVTWDNDQARVLARARVYNAGEHGEYGQSIPGVRTMYLVSEHFLPGLSGVDGNRTNVGVSNPNAVDELVWIELLDTSGTSRGAFATVIPARSYRQFNDIFSHFQAGPLNAAMVRVNSTQQVVYAYASIVRADTGDATFVASELHY
jgi:hypothetical protein